MMNSDKKTNPNERFLIGESLDKLEKSYISQNGSSVPYIELGDRKISQKEFLARLKECSRNGTLYLETIIGAFHFANSLSMIQRNQTFNYSMNQIIASATQMYDQSFAVQSTQDIDYTNIIAIYRHNPSKKLVYQKAAGLGRTVERDACVADGKVKQIIPEKNNSATYGKRESIDSITKAYKEKLIEHVQTRIEMLNGRTNTTQFKWISNPNKQCRLIFKDDRNQALAVYLDSYEEAVRLRDYAICFTLEKNSPINTIGIMKFISSYLRKGRIAEKLRLYIKKYAQGIKEKDEIEKAKRAYEQQQREYEEEQSRIQIEADNKNGNQLNKQATSLSSQKWNSKSIRELHEITHRDSFINDLAKSNKRSTEYPDYENIRDSLNIEKPGERQQREFEEKKLLAESNQRDKHIADMLKGSIGESYQSQPSRNPAGRGLQQSIKQNGLFDEFDDYSVIDDDDDLAPDLVTNVTIAAQKRTVNKLPQKQSQQSYLQSSNISLESNEGRIGAATSFNRPNGNEQQNRLANTLSQRSGARTNYQNTIFQGDENVDQDPAELYKQLNIDDIGIEDIDPLGSLMQFGESNNYQQINNIGQKLNEQSNNQSARGVQNRITTFDAMNNHPTFQYDDMLSSEDITKQITEKRTTVLQKTSLIKDFDRILVKSFADQLKLQIHKITEQKEGQIIQSIQQMREQAERPVNIYLAFHQLQLEFKGGQKEEDMIFKPLLRLEISGADGGDDSDRFVMELRSRISSMKYSMKEFELFGAKKIATLSDVKLVRIRRCSMRIEIIDELTDATIARNVMRMDRLLNASDFMNLLLTIEPVQLLSDKLMISVHLQTYVQQQKPPSLVSTWQPALPRESAVASKLGSQLLNQLNEFQVIEEDEEAWSNGEGGGRISVIEGNGALPWTQTYHGMPNGIPMSIDEHLASTIARQNYITDSFYQSRIMLDRFSPDSFKVVVELIASKGINTASLQLSSRKQSNKLESYQAIQICLFKFYMERQAVHQSKLAKILPDWNRLYESVVTASDGQGEDVEEKLRLDSSEAFIQNEATDETSQYNARVGIVTITHSKSGVLLEKPNDKYLAEPNIHMSGSYSSIRRRIVTSIFYKRDLWEESTVGRPFYDRMVSLSARGIPNLLRQSLWLELGKAGKYQYIIDELLLQNEVKPSTDNNVELHSDRSSIPRSQQLHKVSSNNLTNDNNNIDITASISDRKSHVYRRLLGFSFSSEQGQSKWPQQNCYGELTEDLEWYRSKQRSNNNLYISDQDLVHLTSIFYAYSTYSQLQGCKVIYAKYLIPFAAKALDYFRSSAHVTDDSSTAPLLHLEENVFWLVICLTNNFAKRYYAPIETAMLQQRPSSLIPDGILLDMHVFSYLLDLKNERLSKFLRQIGYSASIYFSERALSLFSDLFNHELLFRIWDFAFLEGSSSNSNKISYFLTAVLITFLNNHSAQIMKACKTKHDVDLYLSLAGKFELDCDVFMALSIALYYSYLQAEPSKFPNAQNHSPPQDFLNSTLSLNVVTNPQQHQHNSGSSTTSANQSKSATQKIFDSILNVSKTFIQGPPVKYIDIIEQAYAQIEMPRVIRQLTFMNQLMISSINNHSQAHIPPANPANQVNPQSSNSLLDIAALSKTLDVLEQKMTSQSSGFDQGISFGSSLMQTNSQLLPPQTNGPSTRGGFSAAQAMIKPIHNFITPSPEIVRIFFKIHGIQMLEDYIELIVKVSFAGFSKTFMTKKILETEIVVSFECNASINIDHTPPFIHVEIYDNINSISLPLKHGTIDLREYLPDTLSHDFAAMINFANSKKDDNDDETQTELGTSHSIADGLGDEVTEELKTRIIEGIQRSATAPHASANIHFSLILATQNGMGTSEAFLHFQSLKKSNQSSVLSTVASQFPTQQLSQSVASTGVIGGLTASKPPTQSQFIPTFPMNLISTTNDQTTQLMDKLSLVPEVFQVRPKEQCESKVKAFNDLKTSLDMDVISHESLNSIKHLYKHRSCLTPENLRKFLISTEVDAWQELLKPSSSSQFAELVNLFNHEGRVSLAEILLVALTVVEGRFPEKCDLYQRIASLVEPQRGFSFQRSPSKRILPSVMMSLIGDIYMKYMMFSPFDSLLNSIQPNQQHVPTVTKAKYFIEANGNLETAAMIKQLSQSSVGSYRTQGGKTDNGSTLNSTPSQASSHSIDMTIFIASFCAQQLQSKGSMDFLLDSQEFTQALRSHFKQGFNIDSPPGRLHIYYWSKGQLRQAKATYAVSTHNSSSNQLSYVYYPKERLGIQNSNSRRNSGTQSNSTLPTKAIQSFKLLDFNDSLLSFKFDQPQFIPQEARKMLASLPLLGYLNSIQNVLFSQRRVAQNINQSKQQASQSSPTVFLKFELDGASKAYFKLFSSINRPYEQLQEMAQITQSQQLKTRRSSAPASKLENRSRQNTQDEQSMVPDQLQYVNRPLATILEDWKIVRNVSTRRSNNFSNTTNDNNNSNGGFYPDEIETKVIPLRMDCVPLYLSIQELSKLISLRLMENCINKLEQQSYGFGDRFWLRFFEQVKHLDMFENLEQVRLFDMNMELSLEMDLSLAANLVQNPMRLTKMEEMQKICLVFDFRSNYKNTLKLMNQPDGPQQYALFHFKDGAKQWLPCWILGCDIDASSTPRFYVEFVAFQTCVYVKSENEISIDQDLNLHRFDLEQMENVPREKKKYLFSKGLAEGGDNQSQFIGQNQKITSSAYKMDRSSANANRFTGTNFDRQNMSRSNFNNTNAVSYMATTQQNSQSLVMKSQQGFLGGSEVMSFYQQTPQQNRMQSPF